jgi:hypothetical protein
MYERYEKPILFCKENVTDNGSVIFTSGHFYEVISPNNPTEYEVLNNVGAQVNFNKIDDTDITYYTNWFTLGALNMTTLNEAYDNTRWYRAFIPGNVVHLVFYNANTFDLIYIHYPDALGDLVEVSGNVSRTVSSVAPAQYEDRWVDYVPGMAVKPVVQ